ncbi:CrcB protein [Corynebacterium striatum]|uniref:Fluoride-specific ion channel FluC n=1 Tax=Corynebacterium striatum TaxID=43770 RepID=A0A2Z2J1Z2_CORST|nr:CrcB family protein [Corynebacterium striatum]ART20624.1 CrcB protein [Corynebacterium striatum]HCG2963379.1 CrcB family protein [Corynebacterium striatum]
MTLFYILFGAFLGGMGRYGFTKVLPAPICTFASNMCGALAIGLAYGFAMLVDAPLANTIYPLAIVGFAGGLSTWSTLAKELGEMIKKKRYWKFTQYLFWTLALGVVLAWRGAMWAPLIYNNF